MGMRAVVAIAEPDARAEDAEAVFDFFADADRRFSPFKSDSELCRLNRGESDAPSAQMREILALADQSRAATKGYFDIRRPDGLIDTSGVVKGWAIQKGARLLAERGYRNFMVEIAGDIQTGGTREDGSDWRVGIRSPFADEVVKVLYPRGHGVATSGSYAQGQHIYNPLGREPEGVVSLTVICTEVLAADIYATAAFAMGVTGVHFIEKLEGFEAYAIDAAGKARMTSGLKRYLA